MYYYIAIYSVVSWIDIIIEKWINLGIPELRGKRIRIQSHCIMTYIFIFIVINLLYDLIRSDSKNTRYMSF